jgi:hypothetical protein
VEPPPEEEALPEARGLGAEPPPAVPLAGGFVEPLVVEVPAVELVAPDGVADVLDGAEARLPNGVAVTLLGTPVTTGGISVALPPSLAGTRTPSG